MDDTFDVCAQITALLDYRKQKHIYKKHTRNVVWFINDMEGKIGIYPYESPFGHNSRGIAMCEERDWIFQLKPFKEWSKFELDIFCISVYLAKDNLGFGDTVREETMKI